MKKSLFVLVVCLFSFACSLGEKEKVVLIRTNYGDVKIKLYNETPLHRDNFLGIIADGTANGFTFDRIAKDFVVQGGKLQTDSVKKTVPAEIDGIYPRYYHKRGAVGAARWDNERNPMKESDATQFYIVMGKRFFDDDYAEMEAMGHPVAEDKKKMYNLKGGAPSLDGEFTVFGEVVEGMDVMEKIQNLKTIEGTEIPFKTIRMKVSVLH